MQHEGMERTLHEDSEREQTYSADSLVIGIIAHVILDHVKVPPGNEGMARPLLRWHRAEQDLVAVLLNTNLHAVTLCCKAPGISAKAA